MFGIGFTEILLIAVLALVVLGPEKLPQLGKTLARFMSEFNKVKREFRTTISDIERGAADDVTAGAPDAGADDGEDDDGTDVPEVTESKEAEAEESPDVDDAEGDEPKETDRPKPEGTREAAAVTGTARKKPVAVPATVDAAGKDGDSGGDGAEEA